MPVAGLAISLYEGVKKHPITFNGEYHMSLPSHMRAVIAGEGKGADCLSIQEVELPEIGANEILIKVAAAGINRPDILQRDGFYPAPKGHSPYLGLEVSGEVVATGADQTRWVVGDKVTALVNGGGCADYVAAHEGAALPVPDALSMVEAAALPETVFTVWHNVFERGSLRPGEWLLVHGGSSGIGTTAIQMAKALGANVAVTAGSEEKCAACRELGADLAINYKEADFVEAVKEASKGRGMDVILDMVGGSYIEKNFSAVAMDGRIVQIAFLEGAKAEVNFMRLMMKRLIFTGSTLRARDEATKAQIASHVEETIWPLVAEGHVSPVISKVFDFENVVDAHALMDSGQHIGKIMLRLTQN